MEEKTYNFKTSNELGKFGYIIPKKHIIEKDFCKIIKNFE